MTKNTDKFTPNMQIEAEFGGLVAGVDEAGRGPLAGPVVAAAVILDKQNLPAGLNDSKKLSANKRNELKHIIVGKAIIGIGIAEPEEIDRINILQASLVAMQRAVYELDKRPDMILVDGNHCPDFGLPAKSVIKGDSKSLSIAAASIIAKTVRDEIMQYADNRITGYGFSGHKGYPTKIHRQALEKLGISPIHRRSYSPVRALLTNNNK